MKFVVLGATGATGLEIVRQAIDRGHQVTALVRAPERLKEFSERITIIRGDLLNSSELQRVIAGHDAVLSGFGPRLPLSKSDHDLLRRFAVALTGAMNATGVRRVVVESTAFLFKDSILPPVYLLGRLFFPQIVRDAGEMESIFAKSGLDWTMVRPPRLTDKPPNGPYRVREGHLPSFGFSASRADVAHFIIWSAEKGVSLRKVVGLSN